MTRTQTMVQLSAEIVADLDREAARRGCSRSAVIREAVIDHLSRTSLEAKVRAYVEAYTRDPQPGVDLWGDLDTATDRAGREAARSLGEYERASGSSW